MLEFALANLMAMGHLPRTVATYMMEHKEELEEARQRALLAQMSREDMGEA